MSRCSSVERKRKEKTVVTGSYQSPEVVDLGNADLRIFGEKPGPDFDQPTMSCARFIPNVIDVDE